MHRAKVSNRANHELRIIFLSLKELAVISRDVIESLRRCLNGIDVYRALFPHRVPSYTVAGIEQRLVKV